MDKFDRVLILHRLFTQYHRGRSLVQLAEELECCTKTVTRTIELMRDQLNAPIEYIKAEHGYRYLSDDGEMFELPGLWLSANELQSMVLLLGMLENLGNSLLGSELKAVKKLINKNLSARGVDQSELSRRIKVLPLAYREIDQHIFTTIGTALLARERVALKYNDYQGQHSSRIISPQTLVYYRDNWYLDAWCHQRNDFRVFSLARIASCRSTQQAAKNYSQSELTAHFSDGYGIFSGETNHLVELKFCPPIAVEIARQQWHPQQESKWHEECYCLSFPYSDQRELIQDIFRHLPHVEVVKPASLKKAVRKRLEESLLHYT